MSNYKKLGIVACALLILGVFIPFISVNAFGIKMSLSLIKGWKGVVILILGLLNLLILFFDELKNKISALEKIEKIKNNKVMLGAYAVALAIGVITGISASSESSYASLALGFWAILAGGIIGLVSAWKMKDQDTNKTDINKENANKEVKESGEENKDEKNI